MSTVHLKISGMLGLDSLILLRVYGGQLFMQDSCHLVQELFLLVSLEFTRPCFSSSALLVDFYLLSFLLYFSIFFKKNRRRKFESRIYIIINYKNYWVIDKNTIKLFLLWKCLTQFKWQVNTPNWKGRKCSQFVH